MIYKSQEAKPHTLSRLVHRKICAICKSSCAFLKLCLIRSFAFFLADCRLWEVVKTKIWSQILKTLIIPDRHSPRVYLCYISCVTTLHSVPSTVLCQGFMSKSQEYNLQCSTDRWTNYDSFKINGQILISKVWKGCLQKIGK